MQVWAFDVDDTIEVSSGPVTLKMMMDLRCAGHIVGLCGNWGVFLQRTPGWQHLISFFNYACSDKVQFLNDMRQHMPADEYILVGNVGPHCASVFYELEGGRVQQTGGSNDMSSAHYAGWRFIKEHDFAKGNR